MRSERNNQEETESLYPAKQDEQSMIIGMSMYQTNLAMKYIKKSNIRNPNQDNQSYQCHNAISKHASKTPNVQSRDRYSLIDPSNVMFASS